MPQETAPQDPTNPNQINPLEFDTISALLRAVSQRTRQLEEDASTALRESEDVETYRTALTAKGEMLASLPAMFDAFQAQGHDVPDDVQGGGTYLATEATLALAAAQRPRGFFPLAMLNRYQGTDERMLEIYADRHDPTLHQE